MMILCGEQLPEGGACQRRLDRELVCADHGPARCRRNGCGKNATRVGCSRGAGRVCGQIPLCDEHPECTVHEPAVRPQLELPLESAVA